MLHMTHVASRSVAEVGYDPVFRDLHVRYHRSEAYYIYRGVPPHVFQRLMDADSKGAFVNAEIKGNYVFDIA